MRMYTILLQDEKCGLLNYNVLNLNASAEQVGVEHPRRLIFFFFSSSFVTEERKLSTIVMKKNKPTPMSL